MVHSDDAVAAGLLESISNLKPTNHCSRNTQTVISQPVSQERRCAATVLLEARSQTDQTAPSFSRSIPHIPPSPRLTYQGTRKPHTRLVRTYRTSVRREGESEMGCAKVLCLTDGWRWASSVLVFTGLHWSALVCPGLPWSHPFDLSESSELPFGPSSPLVSSCFSSPDRR